MIEINSTSTVGKDLSTKWNLDWWFRVASGSGKRDQTLKNRHSSAPVKSIVLMLNSGAYGKRNFSKVWKPESTCHSRVPHCITCLRNDVSWSATKWEEVSDVSSSLKWEESNKSDKIKDLENKENNLLKEELLRLKNKLFEKNEHLKKMGGRKAVDDVSIKSTVDEVGDEGSTTK